jgi:hypothetical protein
MLLRMSHKSAARNALSPDVVARAPVDEKAAAILTGVSTSYLRAARCGRGSPGPPFVRIGRKILYLPNDLGQWVHSRRVTTR